MANYIATDQPDLMWVEGQSSADGTHYLAEIIFTPVQ